MKSVDEVEDQRDGDNENGQRQYGHFVWWMRDGGRVPDDCLGDFRISPARNTSLGSGF
jgi:hypothetical protein